MKATNQQSNNKTITPTSTNETGKILQLTSSGLFLVYSFNKRQAKGSCMNKRKDCSSDEWEERKRNKKDKDGLMWFSDTANELLYEEYFHLTNIETDFLPVFKRFYTDEKLRTCPKTGEVMAVDKRYV